MTDKMENELRESPKRQNKNAAIILAAFGTCVLVCLVSQIVKAGNGIVTQILLLLFAAAFIFVYAKSYLTIYEYVLMRDDEGTVHFAVVQIKGRRKLTLVCVPLSGIGDIITYNRDTDVKRPKIPRGKKMNYCISILPYKYQVLDIVCNFERVKVQVEMSDEFFSVFKRLLSESKHGSEE